VPEPGYFPAWRPEPVLCQVPEPEPWSVWEPGSRSAGDREKPEPEEESWDLRSESEPWSKYPEKQQILVELIGLIRLAGLLRHPVAHRL
jgi:hypothetical protein